MISEFIKKESQALQEQEEYQEGTYASMYKTRATRTVQECKINITNCGKKNNAAAASEIPPLLIPYLFLVQFLLIYGNSKVSHSKSE